jgi:hypothetical protein
MDALVNINIRETGEIEGLNGLEYIELKVEIFRGDEPEQGRTIGGEGEPGQEVVKMARDMGDIATRPPVGAGPAPP